MRTKHFNRKASAALLAALLASVIATLAQTEKNSTPERRPPSGDEPGRFQRTQMAGGPGGRFGPGFDRLQSVLTDDQRASLREAFQGQREKMRDLEEKLRDQRQDLLLAGFTEKFDEEAVRKKALAVAKLEAEMTVLRTKAFSQIRPALTSQQLEKLKAPPAGPGPDQSEAPRRRPDVPRDEHGLPLKDSPPAPKPPQP